MSCICGAPSSTAACCGPLVSGARRAPTAEALMRSRYTAYVMQAIDYLAATQDPATADRFDREAAARWARQARWQGLRVVAVEGGGADDDAGIVEFVASYRVDGEPRVHHERSRFRRLDDGRWVYSDGQAPRATREPRIGRNARCPCGSGKKFKRCCGAG